MIKLLEKTQIIDVTLRDGGYRNNFNFSMEFAINHARKVYESGIDYIEIGYRKGTLIPIENIGITGISSNDYINTIHRELPDLKLVVMAHAHNIDELDVHEMADNGVSMIRFCVNSKNLAETFILAKIAKQRGLFTSFNIVRISSIESFLLKYIITQINKNKDNVDVVYIADSNGNMNPSEVSITVTLIKENSLLNIGFHAHDNIGLAMANSVTAIERGATFIDASLLGMGKGIGNLKLEQWIAYNLSFLYRKYSLKSILSAISDLRRDPGYILPKDNDYNVYMLCGLFNVPFTERKIIENRLLN